VMQRIQVRKLLQDAGIGCKPDEEPQMVPVFLAELRRRAEAAGGDPPRPARPSTTLLDEIAWKSGNEQLVAVYDHRDALAKRAEEWRRDGEEIQKRSKRWEALQDLLRHADSVEGAAGIRTQRDAVRDGRLLLTNPDPVPPLVDAATQLLRDALNAAASDFQQRFAVELDALSEDPSWQKLTTSQRDALLAQHGVADPPLSKSGSADEILATLTKTPLGVWRDRREALPTRFQAARLGAAKLVEPTARPVKLPSRTLRSPEEARAWLSEVEALVLERLGEGPVVV